MFENEYPTIEGQITTRGQNVKCPHCDGYTYIPPYRNSPQECDRCNGKFNVPGRLG